MARNTSAAFKRQIRGDRVFCVRIIITYADETSDTLTDLSDFMRIKFTDECSGPSEFEIGAAIIGEAAITLNNRSGKFGGKDFYRAKITGYAGIIVDGLPELLPMGRYVVDEPVTPGTSIQLIAYDNMIRLDRPYNPGILFPATLAQIAEDACTQSGVLLADLNFSRSDYVVSAAPEGCTCREVIAAIAQLGGCFARADADGRIAIRWYSDTVSHTIDSLRSKTICTDDVTVTGITVYTSNEITGQAGADGYRLAINDNPLLEYGREQETANYLASRIVGMSFRPMSITCQSDMSIEAGDRIIVSDAGGSYETYVTSTTYSVLEAQSVACNAASPTVNGSRRLSDTARAVIMANHYTQQAVSEERTAREVALQNLADRLATGSGLYMTSETREDGSSVYYMHDKPLLADSGIVWKMTAEAIGISTDGGVSYPYGMDVSGTAILDRIYTVGLNADYITSGSITAKDDAGNIVFMVNVDTGEVVLNASSIVMTSGQTVQQEIDTIQEQKMYRVYAYVDGHQIFTSKGQSARMYAIVTSWDEDITDSIDASKFCWHRKSGDDAADLEWDAYHVGAKSITITTADVANNASFCVEVDL